MPFLIDVLFMLNKVILSKTNTGTCIYQNILRYIYSTVPNVTISTPVIKIMLTVFRLLQSHSPAHRTAGFNGGRRLPVILLWRHQAVDLPRFQNRAS